MKIAEALIERKELIKKMNRLNEEITASLVTEVELAPAEGYISSRLADIISISTKLSLLNGHIATANAANLSIELNELKTLDALISFHQKWRKALLNTSEGFMYGRGEKTYKTNYDIETMNVLLEKLEEERRAVDKTLQRRNWELDI